MSRFLIVDDHPLVRRGIAQLLNAEYGEGSVIEAGQATEAMDLIRGRSFSLVILDISLPGRNGLDVLKEIVEIRPGSRVLILSSFPEDQFAIRVLRSGAAGYLTKDSAPETLLLAVRQILAAGRFISPSVADRLASELNRNSAKALHEVLSDREYDVLLRLAGGATVGGIADQIHLSVKTVSTYRTRILEKMGMSNNSELIQYALRNRLVE